ncbi:hypothetical protein EDS67_29210 [candidate division KSB1 bacterium]|nr:MAG: hypothetical protein EDS67_29210 [candidate division KSB1 bacterium]MBC6950522.1 hypothetical protein [candidate division KSB1 bacterium]MCE7945341.1 hypothetical protein [Chlorobi bacterium CHB1]MDL1878158.1 hypothetical protein [Cytophagia bacterium CHB2]
MKRLPLPQSRKQRQIILSGKAIAYILPLLFFLFSCGKSEWNSRWRAQEITVDGKQQDWDGALVFADKEKIAVGLMNDRDDLFACLVVDDREVQASIMRRGLIVWFDATGKKDKTFGIHFPLSRFSLGPPMLPRSESEEPQKDLASMPTEMEILGPGKDDRQRLPLDKARGIDLNINRDNGVLIYEIRIPLRHGADRPYAIGANPGDKIGIGLETPEFDRKEMRERMRSGMGERPRGGMSGGRPGGGFGGGGRGGGMGRPGGPGGQRPELPESLKVWTKVQLAASPAQ